MATHHCTDDHLEAILAETGDWAIVGGNDALLRRAASLGHAIDLTLDLMFGKHLIIALVLRPSDRIVVFTDQVFRVWEHMIGRHHKTGNEDLTFTL